MNQYKVNVFEAPVQMIGNFVVYGSLLFSIGALNFYPLGSALRYYTDALAVCSLVYLLLSWNKMDWACYGKSFIYCCAPFLPFLLVYIAVKAYHGISLSDDGIFFFQLVLLIVSSCFIFGVLVQSKRVSRELFFGCCAIACILYSFDIFATAMSHGVPVWRVKAFVHPYSTTYARCICLTAGLALLGFFLLPSPERRLRYSCLVTSILGFCSSIWFMGIRSIVLTPVFAIIVGFCASSLKLRTKVLTLILFGILATIVAVQSPMVSKMRLAYDEAVNVISSDAVKATLSNINKKDLSPQEKKKQKYLNTSVGARIAVWGIAGRALEDHMWLGTGMGRPHNFVNTKKLFRFSRDYLKHFHSDYVQVSIVGGLALLGAFLITQIWLLFRPLKDPLIIFMTISMISYGVIDYGFLDRRVLVCYLGACLIIWSWHYPERQMQIDSET